MRDRAANLVVVLVVVIVVGMQLRGVFPALSWSAASATDRVMLPGSAGTAKSEPAPSEETLQAIRRTMADMRTIGRALDAYSQDTNVYPGTEEWADTTVLESDLVPLYLGKLPTSDGWGWAIQYRLEKDGRGYALRSRGSDGVLDPRLDTPLSPLAGGDVVFTSGAFSADTVRLERSLDGADRQHQVLDDLRSIGTACEEYAIDNNFYPVLVEESDVDVLAPYVMPDYIKQLPPSDPWGHPYRYRSGEEENSYRIRSFGKDGREGPEGLDPESADEDRDLVFEMGQFLDGPALEAIQKRQKSDTARCDITIERMYLVSFACAGAAEAQRGFPAFTGWTSVGNLHLALAKGPTMDLGQVESVVAQDAWGAPLQYRVDPSGHGFWIRSLGSDGAVGAPADAGPGDPRRDLVMKNGFLDEEGGCGRSSPRRADPATRLKQTMGVILQVAGAVQAYAVDHRFYPVAEGWKDIADLGIEDFGGGAGIGSTVFLYGDGWGHGIEYLSTRGSSSYTIRSLGKDGAADAALVLGPTDELDADIVFSNGTFHSWPRRLPPSHAMQRSSY